MNRRPEFWEVVLAKKELEDHARRNRDLVHKAATDAIVNVAMRFSRAVRSARLFVPDSTETLRRQLEADALLTQLLVVCELHAVGLGA